MKSLLNSSFLGYFLVLVFVTTPTYANVSTLAVVSNIAESSSSPTYLTVFNSKPYLMSQEATNSKELWAFVSYPFIGGDNFYEWITEVAFGDIINSTGQENIGYGDYSYLQSGLITDVFQGKTYPLSVTISAVNLEYVTAFLDWNHDGDFDDTDESVTVATDVSANGPHTVNVQVPLGAVPGETRLRVVLKYNAPPPSSADLGYGEAEDYTINVKKEFSWPMFLPTIINKRQQ